MHLNSYDHHRELLLSSLIHEKLRHRKGEGFGKGHTADITQSLVLVPKQNKP